MGDLMVGPGWIDLAGAVLEEGVKALVPGSGPVVTAASKALGPQKDRLRQWSSDDAEKRAIAESITQWGRGAKIGDADIEDGMRAARATLRQKGASMELIAQLNNDPQEVAKNVLSGDTTVLRSLHPGARRVCRKLVEVFYVRLIGQNPPELERAVYGVLLERSRRAEERTSELQDVHHDTTAVPVALAVKDPGSVFTAVDVEAFTGREWLTSKVDEFFASHHCGYVSVVSEAGLGKTAFAAWLVMTRGYLSHFSRFADGRSIAAALQNLSAQLIRQFDLDDVAPGGMLPDWTGTPSGFESILGRAAAKARQAGRRVVLVVDGLDEAEQSGDGRWFGLPRMLPEGVYVVATYRTGLSPGRSDSPTQVLRINRTDPRNTEDMRGYLIRVTRQKGLADRLTEAGTDQAWFIEQLIQGTGGIWLYLRYILDEVRLGLRSPDALLGLPARLLDYYADQIHRWKQRPDWNDAFLPLLSTIGVAAEALPVTTLAQLAGGLDEATVRTWCHLTARPFLTATPSGVAGGPLRYAIYHASFREALTARPYDHITEPSNAPPELEALADEMRPAIISAHSRIVDGYLSRLGNPELDDRDRITELGELDDGYALRWLAFHLICADRDDDLHRLLARSSQGHNVLFEVHVEAGDPAGYVRDVTLARQSTPRLALQLRYAIMEASIASRSTMLPPVLLSELVRRRVWTPSRALNLVEQMTDERSQVQALSAIAAHLPSEELAQAMTLAVGVQDRKERADALVALIPRAPHPILESRREHLLSSAAEYYHREGILGLGPLVALADRLGGDSLDDLSARSEASGPWLRAVMAFFRTPDRLENAKDALALAARYDETYIGAEELLASLIPYFPREAYGDVIALLRTKDLLYRKETVTRLVRHSPAESLSEVVDIVQGAHWPSHAFVSELALRVADLPLTAAWDIYNSLEPSHARTPMFVALISRLDSSSIRGLLDEALTHGEFFHVGPLSYDDYVNPEDGCYLVAGPLLDRLLPEHASTVIAGGVRPHLPSPSSMPGPDGLYPYLPRYAVAAQYLTAQERVTVLEGFASYISMSYGNAKRMAPFLVRFSPLTSAELDMLFSFRQRAEPFTSWPGSVQWFADLLAPNEPDHVLESISERLTRIPMLEESCFTAIAALGKCQDAERRDRTAKRGLDLAATIGNPYRKGQALEELSPILSGEALVARVFAMLDDVGVDTALRVKDRLSPTLSNTQIRATVDEAYALSVGTAIWKIPRILERMAEEGFTDVINRFLPSLTPGLSLRDDSLDPVLKVSPLLSAPQADKVWRSRGEQLTPLEAREMAELVSRFSEGERRSRADEILRDYRGDYANDRVGILLALARTTSTELLNQTIGNLFEPGRPLRDPFLAPLAPHLSESLIEPAFRYAISLVSPDSGIELTALAPRLPASLAELAVAHVRDSDSNRTAKSRAMAALAPLIRSGIERKRLLAEALDETEYWPDVQTDLIPHLPARLRGRAVENAITGLCAQLGHKKYFEKQTLISCTSCSPG
jgi:hypothetical protein